MLLTVLNLQRVAEVHFSSCLITPNIVDFRTVSNVTVCVKNSSYESTQRGCISKKTGNFEKKHIIFHNLQLSYYTECL